MYDVKRSQILQSSANSFETFFSLFKVKTRLGPENLKINLGSPSKVLRKAPYQSAVFLA